MQATEAQIADALESTITIAYWPDAYWEANIESATLMDRVEGYGPIAHRKLTIPRNTEKSAIDAAVKAKADAWQDELERAEFDSDETLIQYRATVEQKEGSDPAHIGFDPASGNSQTSFYHPALDPASPCAQGQASAT